MSSSTEVEKNQWMVDEMRTLVANKPRTAVLGKEFVIYPEVYHPDLGTENTGFLIKEFLKKLEEDLANKTEQESFDFLEVGCGAGYTAILAALASQKCHVWATDINDTAVKNAVENAKLHGVEDRVKPVYADVFAHKIIAEKKFDIIYWNIPWFGPYAKPGTDLEMLMRSIMDPGYQSFRRYLSEAKHHLKETGRIFVAFSFDYGSKETFDKVVKETGWSYKISSSKISSADPDAEICIMELWKQE